MNNIEKRIRILYKKVSKDEYPTERTCEGYIKVLDGIKDELINKGKLGTWDLEEVQIGGFLGVSEEDIEEAMNEIRTQLEEISSGLGIDLDEEVQNPQIPISNSPIINIHQIQSQNQEQYQTQQMNIEILKKELESELRKDSPNESKIKRIINNIIEVAKSSASGIITSILMKAWGV